LYTSYGDAGTHSFTELLS